MGAKKKGKGNKLARMSEEEKMRYLQHRAAVEEEARRRKEQLISIFMKNKLKREEGFSRLNMAKINQQWRQTLRQIKCVEMKMDLEDLFRWFDYTSNKKNKIIETLLDDLEEAETQYSRMHHCHTEVIGKLLGLHEERIGRFFRMFKEEEDEIYRKAKADLDDIVDFGTADEEHLQATLYKMEEAREEKIRLMTARHTSKVDEARNNMLTELENLKTTRELQIEKIWTELKAILKQYWDQTEDRRRQYLIMRDADSENCKQIFENNHQINAATETVNSLKGQLEKIGTARSQRFLECKAKEENARKLLHSLKKKVNEETDSDREKLIFMNTIACQTTDHLQQILARGEQILQLQSLCRKFETLTEKICPEGLDKPQLTEEEENDIRKEAERFTEPLAQKTVNEVLGLTGFWKRYNRALLEKEALALHYQSLQNEQTQLKSVLKSYLAEVVIKRPETQVSHANGVRISSQRPRSYAPNSRKSLLSADSVESKGSFRQIITAQIRQL